MFAGELRLHATIPFIISTFALASLAYNIDTSPPLAFLSLLAATSIWGSNGILYSYPAAFLQGPAAATGIALINTVASLGGVIGPMLLGGLAWLCHFLLCAMGQAPQTQHAKADKTTADFDPSATEIVRASLVRCILDECTARGWLLFLLHLRTPQLA